LTSLKHEDEMVVSASIWALGEMGDTRAVEPLFDIGERADQLMRSDIVWALGRIGGSQAQDALEKISLFDSDSGIRREAEKLVESGIGTGEKEPSG
ncbi:MAG: HEAT repeat domain-containing protein, partial [bacterium]